MSIATPKIKILLDSGRDSQVKCLIEVLKNPLVTGGKPERFEHFHNIGGKL